MANRTRFDEFTEEERQIITDVVRRGMQDMTPEEVTLYAEWQSCVAVNDAQYVAERDAMTAQIEAVIADHQAVTAASIEAMNAMRDLALERLERARHGQA